MNVYSWETPTFKQWLKWIWQHHLLEKKQWLVHICLSSETTIGSTLRAWWRRCCAWLHRTLVSAWLVQVVFKWNSGWKESGRCLTQSIQARTAVCLHNCNSKPVWFALDSCVHRHRTETLYDDWSPQEPHNTRRYLDNCIQNLEPLLGFKLDFTPYQWCKQKDATSFCVWLLNILELLLAKYEWPDSLYEMISYLR